MAFLLGVALATTTGTTIVYLTAGSVADPSAESSGNDAIDYVVIAYAPAGAGLPQETETKPPAWMGKLQTANARFAFRLGLLLFLLMPTDIITMFAVGGYLGRYVNPWWHTLLFVGLTLLLAGAPLLILLLLGKRADVLLPKMRDWMQANRGS